ncbi:LysM peptidoglycan-binding domain-containing protein [Jeotgalibacillus salarius]|uniref:LysM peptidoglycan-binding domain-containing protein n=1 Tax=Jeotgalibacillus salarius TaxID=546023 RepID=A0A4Y8LJB8_9BACL|nr:LysM peptidoglycan-binding domain-containing protein [Jeotgalibacillus salarius]TFE03110.1 LysM peptidoglycan-binding domain-containing protein [Jeotgalibacillus salarius]
MKRDPYRDRAEKDRKEILASKKDDAREDSNVKSRLELHSKKREEKKSNKKPFPLIGLLLASFVLLPLTVVLVSIFLFSNNESSITNATLENSNEFQIEKNRETALSDKAEPVLAGTISNDDNQEGVPAEEAEEEPLEETVEETVEEPIEEPAESPEAPAEEEPVEEPVEEPQDSSNEAGSPSGSTHTVQANETLYRISVNYGLGPDGVEQLKQLNGLGDNEIYVGQVLQLP